MSYISVLGAGAWGTALALLLAGKEYDVSLWVYEQELADEMRETRVNRVYLPEVSLPDNISITADMAKAVKGGRYILSVVPTQFTRRVVQEALPHTTGEVVLVSASKGIENGTYLTVSSILKCLTENPVAVLSGPSFAKEVIQGLPTAVTLASEDEGTGLLLQEVFNTETFRVYTHHDIIGVELGGALKNVMAIAAGIAEGLSLGSSARAALITRGLAEMARLGVSLGAHEKTFSGLSGLGDLVLTCNSHLSRNFTVGYRLGKGEKLPDITASRPSVAEGVFTTRAAFELAHKKDVEMPIVEQIHRVLYDGKPPGEAVLDLMRRTLKAEFHG